MRLSALILLLTAASAPAADTHVVIRGASIHDGTGKPGVVGDVHIRNDKVATVGTVGDVPGAKVIDGKGLVVCPGFIDLHPRGCRASTRCRSSVPRVPNRNPRS